MSTKHYEKKIQSCMFVVSGKTPALSSREKVLKAVKKKLLQIVKQKIRTSRKQTPEELFVKAEVLLGNVYADMGAFLYEKYGFID